MTTRTGYIIFYNNLIIQWGFKEFLDLNIQNEVYGYVNFDYTLPINGINLLSNSGCITWIESYNKNETGLAFTVDIKYRGGNKNLILIEGTIIGEMTFGILGFFKVN